MSDNILTSGNKAVGRFVYESLFVDLIKPSCGTKINVNRAFCDFLLSQNVPALIAEERAEKWATLLVDRIYREASEWENLGLPRPIEVASTGSQTFITWKHPKFSEITGFDPLPELFAELMDWINSKTETSFLFVCACILKLGGADPIYITDGSGDGGIDLIGRIDSGPLRSMCFFVQAKSSTSRISRETVLLEHGKFLAMTKTVQFTQFLPVQRQASI